MRDRFALFLTVSRWTSVILILMYHVRFLLFVNSDAVREQTQLCKAFYFVTGVGQEAFAVFFLIEGTTAGLLFLRPRLHTAGQEGRILAAVRRRYKVLVVGLILGACLDLVAALFNQFGHYTNFAEFSKLTLTSAALLGNLLIASICTDHRCTSVKQSLPAKPCYALDRIEYRRCPTPVFYIFFSFPSSYAARWRRFIPARSTAYAAAKCRSICSVCCACYGQL